MYELRAKILGESVCRRKGQDRQGQPRETQALHEGLGRRRKHNIEYLSRGKRPPLSLKMKYALMNRTLFSIVRNELGLEHPNIFPTAGATVSEEVECFVHSIGIDMIVGYGLTESLATVSCDHKNESFTVVGRSPDQRS